MHGHDFGFLFKEGETSQKTHTHTHSIFSSRLISIQERREEEEQKILSIPLEPQPVFFVSFFVPVVCSRSRPIDRAEEKPVNEYQHTQRKKTLWPYEIN